MMPQALSGARTDTLRAALDSVFADPAFRWESRPDPFGVVRRAWLALGEQLARLRAENPLVYRILLWGLVLTLAAILVHAAWVAVRTVRGGSRRDGGARSAPPPAPRDAAWHAAEAARLAGEGRFVEAMQADFVRLVLELDARRVTRYHPSKTPGEYVREATLPDDRRRDLRELVRALYAHAFARVPCDAVAYAAWRQRAVADRYAPAH